MMRWIKGLAMSVMGAAGGLLLYCGSFYLKSYQENRIAQEKYDNIREMCLRETGQKDEEETKETQETEETKETIRESFGISWEKLKAVNPDIIAWITIPGADISYPVVQGKDDEYYLNHSVTGEEDCFGSIFLGCVNRRDFLDSHSFLYGHNMEGNMMFANLNHYTDKEFLESCPEFQVITPERKYCYEIFSVEQANEDGVCFKYGYETGSEKYRKQLEILKENSLYDTGVVPDAQQKMVTLITCNSLLDEDVRMAVHGICRAVCTQEENEKDV